MAIFSTLPSSPLREYVRSYVFRDLNLGSEQVIRPVCAESDALLFLSLSDPLSAFEYSTGRSRVLPATLIVGPQVRRVANLEITGRYTSLSVHFQPGGVYRLFGVPGCELVGRAQDAAQSLDPALVPLLKHLQEIRDPQQIAFVVDGYLLARLHGVRSAHPVHRAALALRRAHGMMDLSRLVKTTGHSVRHFDRVFLSQLGMTPKHYARVSRFTFALRLKMERPQLTWADVSQEAGYFDQNHLVKEFKALAGEAPTACYRALSATPETLRPDSVMPMSNSY